MKKLIKILKLFGYNILSIKVEASAPVLHFRYRDLQKYRKLTDLIPGMIKNEDAEMLYALKVTQDKKGDVVEIGSWHGKSTSYLARAVADSGNGHMYAIDHFMGNIGKESIYFNNGNDIEDCFRKNMKNLNLTEAVSLFACSSDRAREKLSNLDIRILFIDGDHSEKGVKKDINLFCPLVRDGGIVIFDDFNNTSPGVILAAQEWIKSRNFSAIFLSGNMLVCKL